MSRLGEVMVSARHIPATERAGRMRVRLALLRPRVREVVMLWAMRAAMLGYVLAMVAAAEAALQALRRLF